jgi:hypothetical protein
MMPTAIKIMNLTEKLLPFVEAIVTILTAIASILPGIGSSVDDINTNVNRPEIPEGMMGTAEFLRSFPFELSRRLGGDTDVAPGVAAAVGS